jgi:hypothetical protein
LTGWRAISINSVTVSHGFVVPRETKEKAKIRFFLLTCRTSFDRFLALTDSLRFGKTSVFGWGNFAVYPQGY